MTELGLIIAVNIAALAFAWLLARWVRSRDSGAAGVRRVGAAIERAAASFLRSQYRLVAGAAAALAVMVFVFHGGLLLLGRPDASAKSAFWMALAIAMGAGTLCLVVHLAARIALSGTVRMLTAGERSLDRALSVALRAGAVGAFMAEALSVLGVLSTFCLLYAMKGGFSMAPAGMVHLAYEVALLTPGFALGAAGAALVIQRSGSAYHVAGDVGGDLAGERDAGLEHDDARNPAVIAGVGDHAGLVARTADLFVSGAMVSVVAVAFGAKLLSGSAAPLSPWSLVVLPLVARTFGLVASGFGVMVVRTGEAQPPAAALLRGFATTVIVAMGGLLGAAFWLVGGLWLELSLAGALGVTALVLGGLSTMWRLGRRSAPVREAMDALRVGEAPTSAQALGVGLEAAFLPVLLIGGALVAAFSLGRASGLAHGPLLFGLVALVAMFSAGPYMLALGSFASIADSALGVATTQPAAPSEDGQRRALRLDEAGVPVSSLVQGYLVLVGAVAALLLALTLPVLAGGGEIDLAKPVVAMSGALGAAAVLSYMGHAMRCSARGARGVALEVERQLRGFPRLGGLAQLPRDYTPSYRACIDLTARTALSGSSRSLVLALLPPTMLGIGLSIMYPSTGSRLTVEGLACFVVVASATSLAASLATTGARAVLSTVRRLVRPRGSTPGFAASVGGDATADIMGNAAGPAAHLLTKAAAITSLTLIHFLT